MEYSTEELFDLFESKRIVESKQIFENLKRKSKFYKSTGDECDHIEYVFKKIQKIDDIKVEVTLECTHAFIGSDYEKIRYIIKSLGIQQDGYDDYSDYVLYASDWFDKKKPLDIQLVRELLNDLHDKIKDMKLDKTFGKLLTETCEEDFDDYIDGEDCCVCYHKTVTRTDCEHHLCISCWNSMFKNDLIKCPLCNSEYIYVFTNQV